MQREALGEAEERKSAPNFYSYFPFRFSFSRYFSLASVEVRVDAGCKLRTERSRTGQCSAVICEEEV